MRSSRTLFLPLFSLLLLALSPLAAAQTVRVAGVESDVVLQAQRDVAGADLVGKDGPLARLGFELALLYRSFEMQGSTAAVEAIDPHLRVAGDLVVVDFVARGDPRALLVDLEALGLQGGTQFGRYVSGRLPIAAIPAAADLATLHHGRASAAATSAGSVASQGDAAMRADVARTDFGIDGTGISIGTLSDSYDCLGGAAGDVASNDLPAGVTVLADETGCASGSDEGRGMMQLIHDVAPGSSQLFHTAFDGFADFAQGVLDLEAAGADVIVDDVSYFAAAMFQDDIVAQAADEVVALGVPYFSSAGNNARQSYESAFRSSGTCPAPIAASGNCDAHDFDPGAGVDVFQSISVPNNVQVTFSMQWDQPFFSISGSPGSASDLDFYLLDSTNSTILGFAGTDFNIGGDPVELGQYTNTTGITQLVNVVIVKYLDVPDPGPDPGLVKYLMFGGNSVVFNEYDTDSATVFGHANAAGAAAVGAAFFAETPEFGQSPPLLEPFSSAGGTPILFDIAGNPTSSARGSLVAGNVVGEMRNQPRFTAPDGTNTTFFGTDTPADADTFPNFFGTSAAAPHAAAVAALLLELEPGLTPDEIYGALADSAIDMGAAGFDDDSGVGLIQADAAAAAAQSPGVLAFAGATFTVAEDGGTATITVTRNGGDTGAVSVDYATADGSADAGSDYTATSGTLNWADGATGAKSFTVAIVDDAEQEGDETVLLSLSNPTGGATLGLDSATLTIERNDIATAALTVAKGANSPPATVSADAGDEVAVLQVDLAAPGASDDLTVEGLTLRASQLATTAVGPQAGLADIVAVTVYLDANGDGQVDPGELSIASGTLDAGSGNAVIDFGANAVDLDAGESVSLLITLRFDDTLSGGVGGAGLALLLAPLGLGLVARLRRRRLLLLPLLVLLTLLLTACPTPAGPTAGTFTTRLTEVEVVADSVGAVDVDGLPLDGSTVTVSP